MNENQLIDLLKAISKEAGSELITSGDSVPLMTATIYQITGDKLSLNVKITKTASTGSNTHISLDFKLYNQAVKPFSMKMDRGLFAFFSNKIKFKATGDTRQETAHFLLAELRNNYFTGVKLLKIEGNAGNINIAFKTLYLESLKSMLEVLLKLIKR